MLAFTENVNPQKKPFLSLTREQKKRKFLIHDRQGLDHPTLCDGQQLS